MKTHTNDFKTNIKNLGRELAIKVTYGNSTLGNEQINSANLNYKGDILKSVMKQLELDSNIDIPLETQINVQTGLLVNGAYEYINYGDFIVNKSEKQENTNSYILTCYDKMLLSMVPYEDMQLTYPITIRAYLSAICTKLGLTFANSSDTFTNYDNEIQNELYLDSDGNSLDYTFRDVLDELAQATASTICINDDNELEVRYIHNVGEYETKTGTSFEIENVDDSKDFELELNGDTSQASTPSPSTPQPINVVTGEQDINVCGKNLLDISGIVKGRLDNGVVGYASDTTRLEISDDSVSFTTSANYRGIVTDYIYVDGITNITYSSNTINTSLTGPMACYGANKNWLGNATATTIDDYRIKYYLISGTKYIRYNRQLITARSITIEKPQLEIGTQATTYEAFKGNTYEINLGKNLFNTQTLNTTWRTTIVSSTNNGVVLKPTNSGGSGYVGYTIKALPSTTYTFSCNITLENYESFNGLIYIYEYNASNTQHYITNINSSSLTKTFTTQSDTTKLLINIYSYSGTTSNWEEVQATYSNIQLEKGSGATTYSPYKTPIELNKIGTYQDKIYRDNGKWYLHKEVAKIILNGNMSGIYQSGSLTNTMRMAVPSGLTLSSTTTDMLCDKLPVVSGYNIDSEHIYMANNNFYIFVNKSRGVSNLATFKTWLNTNNLTCYVVLATPTDTPIEDSELLEQLDSIELLDGVNNISVTSSNLSSPIKLTYLKERDTIDEEYLKNVNVKFGEVYGPINTITLSRSADSDNISLSIPEDLDDDLKKEIKISDNQILNGNNRDTFLGEILEKLYGLSYYINDYSSTGILYYDLCDKYNVKVGEETYYCVMFNDEINLSNGLVENIHTDMPKDSKTNYTKTDKTDRKVNQTTLIVDKQNGTIEATVSKVNNIETTANNNYQELLNKFDGYALQSDVVSIENSVTQLQTDTYTKTEINTKLTDGSVTKVMTASGTFDIDGMRYAKTNAKTSTLINEKGVEVDSTTGNTELLFAGYDETINQTIVRTENINVRRYLVIGNNSRIEDYGNGGGMFIL